MEIYFVWQDRRAQCQYCRVHIDLPDLDPPAPASDSAASFVFPTAAGGLDDSLAKYSLIAGVIGLIGLFPVVASILAIVLGRKSLAQIAEQPQAYGGEKMARGGILTGWIGLGFSALSFCFFVAANLISFILAFVENF
jgi:hypothetical protein